MPLSRITITIPEELVVAADERAGTLDRSRSWVVAEALRRTLESPAESTAVETRVATVREPGPRYRASSAARGQGVAGTAPEPVDVAVEITAARRRRLRAELQLPAEERLRRAEELGRLGREVQGRGARAQVIGFGSYEDYYEWKRIRLIGG